MERREDIVVERKEENRRYSCFKERRETSRKERRYSCFKKGEKRNHKKGEKRRYSCFKERKKEGYWMVAVTRAGTKGSHL